MRLIVSILAVLLCGSVLMVDAADEAAAMALAKKRGCLDCARDVSPRPPDQRPSPG